MPLDYRLVEGIRYSRGLEKARDPYSEKITTWRIWEKFYFNRVWKNDWLHLFFQWLLYLDLMHSNIRGKKHKTVNLKAFIMSIAWK